MYDICNGMLSNLIKIKGLDTVDVLWINNNHKKIKDLDTVDVPGINNNHKK
jgi:hypothetical protein